MSLQLVSNLSNENETIVDSEGERIGLNEPTLENFWASSTLIRQLQTWISVTVLLEMI